MTDCHRTAGIHLLGFQGRMMQEFVLIGGLPGSGKSTLARQLQGESGMFVVSPDLIRLAINAGEYPKAPLHDFLNPVVWELVGLAVRRLLESGCAVALDATNLTRFYRAEWIDLARSVVPGIRVAIHWCDGCRDSAQRWEKERGHTTSEYDAIRRELESTLERPVPGEADELVWHHSKEGSD